MASGTPSAQVRIPAGALIFLPPPPLMLTLYYWGKNYPVAENLCGGRLIKKERQRRGAVGLREVGGGIFIRGGRGWTKNSKKNLTVLKQKYPIPYLNTLRDHSIFLYVTKNTIL